MSLRLKFVRPIHRVLLAVLGAALAWEWRRSEGEEPGARRTRLLSGPEGRRPIWTA